MYELIGMPGSGKSYLHRLILQEYGDDVATSKSNKRSYQAYKIFAVRNITIIILYSLINNSRWRIKLVTIKWLLKFIFREDSMFFDDEGFIQRVLSVLVPESGSLNRVQKRLIKNLNLRSTQSHIIIDVSIDIAFKRIKERKVIRRFQGLSEKQILQILTGFELVLQELKDNPTFSYQVINNGVDDIHLPSDLKAIINA